MLAPFDGVVPYRLEMQAKLAVDGARDLYAFWGDGLARSLTDEFDLLVNCASVEYAKAVTPHAEDCGLSVVTCLFGTLRDGRLVQRSTEAKAARGDFVRWCAEAGVEDAGQMRAFSESGYRFEEGLSNDDALVFAKDA